MLRIFGNLDIQTRGNSRRTMYLFVVSMGFKCSTTFQRMHGSHATSNSIVWKWAKTLNEKNEWIVTHQLGPEVKVPRLFVCIHHANSERPFPKRVLLAQCTWWWTYWRIWWKAISILNLRNLLPKFSSYWAPKM